jgi:site-specific DNA recombinase
MSASMRAAAYARFSSDLQRETSVDDQIRTAREYADAREWHLDPAFIFTDYGISGASIVGRPGLQALLAAAERRPVPFDVVLVDDSSRVARDLADAIRILQRLTFAGVRVVYISQNIDSANEQAETLIAVHGVVDSLYLREMAKKIKRGLIGQHARGFATGSITYGYLSVPVLDPSGKLVDGHPAELGKRIEIRSDQADVIRRVYEWYANGVGIGRIVERLNAERTPAPRGVQFWRDGAVKRLLLNERYRGLQIWGQRTHDRRPGTREKVVRHLPRDQWRIAERPDLRIVDDELWERVQARQRVVRETWGIKDGRRLVYGKNAALHSRHLFSGFMRCAECGGSIVVVCGGHGTSRYGCLTSWRNGVAVCSNRLTVRAPVADRVLLAGLQAELLKPETVRFVADELALALIRLIDERPRRRVALEQQRAAVRRKIDNLVAAIEGGTMSGTLLESLRAREHDLAQLAADLAELETDAALTDRLAVMPTWVQEQLSDIAGLLSAAPERAKAEFARLRLRFTLKVEPGQSGGGGRPFYRAIGEADLPCLTHPARLRSAPSSSMGRAASERSS